MSGPGVVGAIDELESLANEVRRLLLESIFSAKAVLMVIGVVGSHPVEDGVGGGEDMP